MNRQHSTARRRVEVLQKVGLSIGYDNEKLERIALVATSLLNLPMAAISLMDDARQLLQAKVGLTASDFPRPASPCSAVIVNRKALAIFDLKDHPIYCKSPQAGFGARSYAGAPLMTRDGFALGTICVMGSYPRCFTGQELEGLVSLAEIAVGLIEFQHSFDRLDHSSGLPNKSQFLEDINDLTAGHSDKSRTAVLLDLIESSQLENLCRAVGPTLTDSFVSSASMVLQSSLSRRRAIYHVGATQLAYLMPSYFDEIQRGAELSKVVRSLSCVNISGYALSPCVGAIIFTPGLIPPLDVLRGLNGAVQDGREVAQSINFHSTLNDVKHRRRFEILRDFPLALKATDQLSVVFQPRVDLGKNEVVGAEVLLRWDHPLLSSISPGEFAPIIENSMHSESLTAWVLDAALRQLRAWLAHGLSVPLSVNVSASNLHHQGFVESVFDALARNCVPASMLELEVTESSVMKNSALAVASLTALSTGGVKISIDDFGTGHSSLGYLQKLPVTAIKIDKSFVINVANEPKNQKLIELIVKLARGFDHQVVVEGVENVEDLAVLKKVGCHLAQGYLFSRPLSADTFEEFMISGIKTVSRKKTSKRA